MIMKSLKIMSLSFILFIIGSNVSLAQDGGAQLSEEQKEEIAQNLEEFFASLDLSNDQQSEFESITIKYAEQMKAVRDEGGGRMQKFKKIKSIRNDKNKEMKDLLSKNQYKLYLEKQEEMQKEMRNRRENRS